MEICYHASQIADIMELQPRISSHGVPLVYFSRRRENVLVYLSNAVENIAKKRDFYIRGIGQNGDPMDLKRMEK